MFSHQNDPQHDTNNVTPVIHVCAICKTLASEKCSRCGIVFYCSSKHQDEHWPNHKSWCQLLSMTSTSLPLQEPLLLCTDMHSCDTFVVQPGKLCNQTRKNVSPVDDTFLRVVRRTFLSSSSSLFFSPSLCYGVIVPGANYIDGDMAAMDSKRIRARLIPIVMSCTCGQTPCQYHPTLPMQDVQTVSDMARRKEIGKHVYHPGFSISSPKLICDVTRLLPVVADELIQIMLQNEWMNPLIITTPELFPFPTFNVQQQLLSTMNEERVVPFPNIDDNDDNTDTNAVDMEKNTFCFYHIPRCHYWIMCRRDWLVKQLQSCLNQEKRSEKEKNTLAQWLRETHLG